jgi:hypothetical protein
MTNLTFEELKERLAMLDEVTILEILNINSYDLVQRFEDMIEDNRDKLERELE